MIESYTFEVHWNVRAAEIIFLPHSVYECVCPLGALEPWRQKSVGP